MRSLRTKLLGKLDHLFYVAVLAVSDQFDELQTKQGEVQLWLFVQDLSCMLANASKKCMW